MPWKPVLITGALLVLGIGALYGAKAWKGDTILVQTNVPDAVIIVNGTERGKTSAKKLAPLSISHLHGKTYEIIARKEGYEDDRRTVASPVRSPAPITLQLAPKLAGLRLQAVAGSLILLNGNIRGRADSLGSWMDQNLPPAQLFIAVRRDGRAEWTRNLVLKPGETLTLTTDQPEVTPPQPTEAPTVEFLADPPPRQSLPPTVAPNVNRAMAQQLFGRARQAFALRDYNIASRYCSEGLRLVPGDASAAALCRRINDVRLSTNQE